MLRQVFDHVVHLYEELIGPKHVSVLLTNLLKALEHKLDHCKVLLSLEIVDEGWHQLWPVIMEVASRHDRNNFQVKIGYFRISRILRSHHGVHQFLLQNLSPIIVKSLILNQGFSVVLLLSSLFVRVV